MATWLSVIKNNKLQHKKLNKHRSYVRSKSVNQPIKKVQYHHAIISAVSKPSEVIHYNSEVGFKLQQIWASIIVPEGLCDMSSSQCLYSYPKRTQVSLGDQVYHLHDHQRLGDTRVHLKVCAALTVVLLKTWGYRMMLKSAFLPPTWPQTWAHYDPLTHQILFIQYHISEEMHLQSFQCLVYNNKKICSHFTVFLSCCLEYNKYFSISAS